LERAKLLYFSLGADRNGGNALCNCCIEVCIGSGLRPDPLVVGQRLTQPQYCADDGQRQ
jgi:hypothetical protein